MLRFPFLRQRRSQPRDDVRNRLVRSVHISEACRLRLQHRARRGLDGLQLSDGRARGSPLEYKLLPSTTCSMLNAKKTHFHLRAKRVSHLLHLMKRTPRGFVQALEGIFLRPLPHGPLYAKHYRILIQNVLLDKTKQNIRNSIGLIRTCVRRYLPLILKNVEYKYLNKCLNSHPSQ